MKDETLTRNIFFLFYLFALPSTLFAKTLNFYNGTWEQVQNLAQEQNKPIFVEVFSASPAAAAESNVLPDDAEIIDYYNTHFVNYRLSNQSEMGKKLVAQNQLLSFPSFLYFDHKASVVHRCTYNADKETALHNAKIAIVKSLLPVTSMQKLHQSGYRATAFLHDFSYELKKNELPYTHVVNQYIEKKKLKKGIKHPIDIQFIYDFSDNIQSNAMSILLAQLPLFEQRYGKNNIAQKIETTILNAVSLAAEKHDTHLFEKIKQLVKNAKLTDPESLMRKIENKYYNIGNPNSSLPEQRIYREINAIFYYEQAWGILASNTHRPELRNGN